MFQVIGRFPHNVVNIYDVVAPLHVIAKVIGLTPFTISMQKEIFVATASVFDWLSIAFLTSWSVAIMMMLIMNSDEFQEENRRFFQSDIVQSAFMTVTVAYLIISTFSSWWFFIHKKLFAKLMTMLNEVDKDLCDLKVSPNTEKHKKSLLTFVVALNVVIISGGSLHLYLTQEHVKEKYNIF
jgi:7tm Chemosensory receptor